MSDHVIAGGCLCGAVRFAIKDRVLYAGYCHCSQCRRFSGTASTALGGIAAEDLTITSGADLLARYVKSPATTLVFCSICGSSLYAEKPLFGTLHLRYGCLDKPPTLLPTVHMYASSAVSWAPIVDDMPRFDDLGDTATRKRFMDHFTLIFDQLRLRPEMPSALSPGKPTDTSP